jgi:hypothetical protein
MHPAIPYRHAHIYAVIPLSGPQLLYGQLDREDDRPCCDAVKSSQIMYIVRIPTASLQRIAGYVTASRTDMKCGGY